MPDQPKLPDGRPITDDLAREHAQHMADEGRPPNPNCPVCRHATRIGATK